MAPMKRLLLLAVLAVAATAIPAQASAAGPCRNDVYDDWYHDGKIASTYPVSCYRDAIKHVHGDLKIYSSLTDDIRAAMQAAIARTQGKSNVPEQVGKGVSPAETSSGSGPKSSNDASDRPNSPIGVSTIASPPVADSSNGSSVPVPLLVLGGLALLLAAAGGIGMLARRRGNRPSAP
jgi:hypothetical protein